MNVIRWLTAIVVPLVGIAVWVSIGSARGPQKVTVPESWQNLTPEERERRLDDVERKRRAMGRGSSGGRLPEDRSDAAMKGRPGK